MMNEEPTPPRTGVMIYDEADRALDRPNPALGQLDGAAVQINLPGGEANRPVSRNSDRAIFIAYMIYVILILILAIVAAVALMLFSELTTLFREGGLSRCDDGDSDSRSDYLKPIVIAPVGAAYAMWTIVHLYDGIKFVKDADETVKWLVERVFPLLRSSAGAVVERFQLLLSRDRSSHAI